MTPRKRLPYAAGGLLDEIKMNLTDAIRMLHPVAKNKTMVDQDRVMITSDAMWKLRDISDRLNELRGLVEEGKEA